MKLSNVAMRSKVAKSDVQKCVQLAKKAENCKDDRLLSIDLKSI